METQKMKSRYGWIGVGKMGNPMATRLMEAGYAVTVCDPLAENRASLVARGAGIALTAGALAEQCQVIFATIPNDDVLRALVFGGGAQGFLHSLRPGSIFVEMSTVSPQLSQEVAVELAARGVGYLRCPVSGSTALARSGKLTVLASGDAASWASMGETLDLLCSRKFFLGAGEEARYMKLVLNTLVGATSAILGEALTLGEAGGLRAADMMQVISESAVASPLISYKKEMIEMMDFSPAFSVTQMMKDFTLITDAGRAKQIPMFAANMILQQYISAANAGYAQQDFFALFDWMRTAGVEGDLA